MTHQYGPFGGQYVPEPLRNALGQLELAFNEAIQDSSFIKTYKHYLKDYVGRPSPLYYAKALTEHLGGAKIYLKREDLNHTGAHKINNTIGQILLAKRMGKTKIIAETGAGQHGVATATAAAMFGMECQIFQGSLDMERQKLNVFRMQMLGAKVTPATKGKQTLADAVDMAINHWVEHIDDTFYLLGSAVGPHPYPSMVKFFQKIIGEETKQQILEKENRLPDVLMACVGGGSNAIGLFADFMEDTSVKLIGVEASGKGLDTEEHAATMTLGQTGIIHGMKTRVLLDKDNQTKEVYSISAGLDYPGVGPEHAYLQASHRASYTSITDKEAIEAFLLLSKIEGIIPAIESAHAIAEVIKLAPQMDQNKIIIVNLSGRGDKDVQTIEKLIQSR
jgi:tryptophan synthase beta chain